jgi:phosphopantetheinyl transferase (holo-ACP synthase)
MNEETEQIDELSKDTLGSYIKKASHDVASKGAITRHFADKSRRETEEKKHDLAKDSMKRSDKVFASGWKRREGMAKAVDRLTKEDVQLDERTLTSSETSKKEEIVKSMKKGLSGFKQRYGDKAKSVMYATATKQAKKD